MFSLVALTTAVLASCAAATPLAGRQSDPCSGLGNGVTSNTGPFALYAYDVNTATNSTGLPLVVATVPSSSGPTFAKLATWASYQQGQLTQFDLDSNTLVPTNTAQAVDLSVSAGSELEFQFVSGVETPAAAAIYCVVDNSSPTSFGDNVRLAVNGDAGSFSLCEDSDGLDAIVYQASSSNGGAYDFDTCTELVVHVYYSVQPVV